MTVIELIEALAKFPHDAEVLITDGWDSVFYKGDYTITEFEGCVDIGVGGCKEDVEYD